MPAIQHININVNTVGTNPLVAGQAGMRAWYVNYTLIAHEAVIAIFEDTSGVDRIGPFAFAANGGISAPDAAVGWQRSAVGQGISLRLSANVRVGGSLAYRMLPGDIDL